MKFLQPHLGIVAAVAIIAAALALVGAGHHLGVRGVMSEWNADKAAQKQAENLAIFQRLRNNERIAEQHSIDNKRIKEAHHAELQKVRADIARDHATGLRVGPGICAGFAGGTQADGASGGDGADSRARLVREDVGRDLAALKIRVEEALAVGRACQAFVESAGLAP